MVTAALKDQSRSGEPSNGLGRLSRISLSIVGAGVVIVRGERVGEGRVGGVIGIGDAGESGC